MCIIKLKNSNNNSSLPCLLPPNPWISIAVTFTNQQHPCCLPMEHLFWHASYHHFFTSFLTTTVRPHQPTHLTVFDPPTLQPLCSSYISYRFCTVRSQGVTGKSRRAPGRNEFPVAEIREFLSVLPHWCHLQATVVNLLLQILCDFNSADKALLLHNYRFQITRHCVRVMFKLKEQSQQILLCIIIFIGYFSSNAAQGIYERPMKYEPVIQTFSEVQYCLSV